eukprot:186029_1
MIRLSKISLRSKTRDVSNGWLRFERRMIYCQSAPTKPFRLPPTFVDEFRTVRPPFAFNGLGELVYRRTYSRRIEDTDQYEEWYQTVERVVNGTFNMQKQWIEMHNLGWSPRKALSSARNMYTRMFNMKFLPPGRGLWAMGSPLTEKRGLYAALNSCAFVSTRSLHDSGADFAEPFAFLMDASMLGVGVGFDTKGSGVRVRGISTKKSAELFVVPDSREGWVEALERLIRSHFKHGAKQNFDYSQVRPKGTPIRGFGGVSSGSEVLEEMLTKIDAILAELKGKTLSVRAIVDIMNIIGKCVVAGNVRRTAEIAFGSSIDEEYLDLKNYSKNPERVEYGWCSNNSVYADVGMDYGPICDRIRINGEPGLAWLDNMQQYSRMGDPPDGKDKLAAGGNPCLEQTLEDGELCCLVETFPERHDDLADYRETLKCAFLYAKSVTLAHTPWPRTNRIMLRNRRIGCSMSGVAQFVSNRGIDALREWCENGYGYIKQLDANYSDWLAVPESKKVTSIKPSGTVSLLAGATPGCHFPVSRFYIRNVRIQKDSPLLKPLEESGYLIEPAAHDRESMVVGFPIDVGTGVRAESDVSIWEKLHLAAFLQRYWADNQVSCTVTFDPETEGTQLESALQYFQYHLKGVSFLPRTDQVYEQMPYIPISEDKFNELMSQVRPLKFSEGRSAEDYQADRFCDNDSCDISR